MIDLQGNLYIPAYVGCTQSYIKSQTNYERRLHDMIRLTPYEQRMLDGEFGAAKQVALQKIIDYAQILGAG